MPEVLRILSAEKRALMVIEPPGQFWISSVFEINNRVDIAVKKAIFKQLIGTVSQACIEKFSVRIELALKKTSYIGR